MADAARRNALRIPIGPPLRPSALRPRFLAEMLAGVARSARRGRRPGIAPTCARAAEPRSFSGKEIGPGAGATGEPRCRDTAAGAAAGRRERAHEAVASRTAGPDDLAALLAMLDLRTGPDERTVRPEED
ncbi:MULTISPECIES: hypothetical protein [unclassified Streptomyces]|uniref:hypothetical protein n=1 Tax=unclassified Streptomyces TaxID=2593676 RepID=UPI0004BE2362|nr:MULTISPECIES: hypothetical protein [unclassified Streptomyces]